MPDAFAQKNDSSVAIIDAGVQSGEDTPFITAGFHFLPGDFVHASFQITSFASKKEGTEALSKISLQYAASLEDANGLLMAPAESGTIESELGSEDKNWTPKRRVSFTLPPFVSAGKAQVRIVVKDLLAHTEALRILPLLLGGVTVMKDSSLNVQDLQFFRKEDDSAALNLAAFTPGDPIYAKFNMTGFKVDRQNNYRVVYDILVLRPDGKPYVQQPHAAELTASSFYPAQFLPAVLQFTTSADSAKGIYPVIVTVHDLIGNATVQSRTTFTLE